MNGLTTLEDIPVVFILRKKRSVPHDEYMVILSIWIINIMTTLGRCQTCMYNVNISTERFKQVKLQRLHLSCQTRR